MFRFSILVIFLRGVNMNTMIVLTSKNLEHMFKQGGCGDWVAREDRVAKCTYLIAVANAHSNWSMHKPENHGEAFFIGKISGIKPSIENPGRVIIQFSDYAEISLPNAWSGQQNPVRYTTLNELGFDLDPDKLDWKKFPASYGNLTGANLQATIAEAKEDLAKKLGVAPECIEIIVRV